MHLWSELKRRSSSISVIPAKMVGVVDQCVIDRFLSTYLLASTGRIESNALQQQEMRPSVYGNFYSSLPLRPQAKSTVTPEVPRVTWSVFVVCVPERDRHSWQVLWLDGDGVARTAAEFAQVCCLLYCYSLGT